MRFYVDAVDDKYFVVDYYVESAKNLAEAAWGIAIGQSVGNPSTRSVWETDELFQNHSCLIVGNENELRSQQTGVIRIAFPVINTDLFQDGISHVLCQVLGGQVDINHIKKCRVLHIAFPADFEKQLPKPHCGMTGLREFTGVYEKPLLGAIIKPKTGISPFVLVEMVKELVDGGVNFIKEDEILASPRFNRLEDRVEKIAKVLDGQNVIYAFCINGDAHTVLEKAKRVYNLGGNGVHVNVWSGLGVYHSIRLLNLPLFTHFQKSGDLAFTHPDNPYSISWNVICDLAGLMGVDSIHAGMWGGYKSDSESELNQTLSILHKRNVVPALSCGMHPGLVNAVTRRFGCDYMANVGGAIHSHPGGTVAGAKAMRQAIDGDFGQEYHQAIQIFGEYK